MGCFGDTRSVAFVSIADMSYRLLKVGVHRSNLVLCDAEARSGALFMYTMKHCGDGFTVERIASCY